MSVKRIFQAGDYGSKNSYSLEELKSWVDKEFSFPIVAGHIGDYLKNGYPVSSIPKAGVATCVGVDEEGYLLAEIEYNEFGKTATESGAYDSYSLGLDIKKNPNHLALLGYMPPHIDSLDSALLEFGSFQSEEITYIEFEKGGETMTIAEILTFLKALDAASISLEELSDLQETVWKLGDEKWMIKKLEEGGYTVGKEADFSKDTVEGFAKNLGFTLTAVETPKSFTREEWEKQYAAEFSRKQEEKEYTEKFVSLFPPVMKPFAEFCVGEAFNEINYPKLIEFSTEKKVSMADYIKESVKTGGPFAHLFQEFSKDIDGGKPAQTETDWFSVGERAAKL